MKVFVTGGTGFLGRRLVTRLLAEGHEVLALVRKNSTALAEGAEAVVGDLMDPTTYQDAGEGSLRVYHLAAMITFDPARREELIEVNGEGTRRLLETAATWGADKSVVVSSACTLGLSNHPQKILDEDSPLDEGLADRNPYMASKLACEHHALQASQDREVVVVNPTTVYGPGDDSLNSGTLVEKVAKAAALPVPSGGSNVVDVDDVVDGILRAGEQGKSGRRYTLGGENLRFGEIFATIGQVVGRRPLLLPVPGFSRPLFGTAAWVLGRLTGSRFLTPQIVEDLFAYKFYSSERARQELDWQPKYRFSDSVERAWTYYKERGLL